MRLSQRVFAVARSTFKEAIRDRVLLVVLLFALLLVLFSRVLGWLSVEDELKMLQDFSLSGLSLLLLCLSMLVGSFSLAREIERRTTYTLLTRDLMRGELILGKFCGLVLVFWTCLLLCALVLTAWLFLWGGRPQAALLAAVIGLMFEALALTAVALFLGSSLSPAIAAVGTLSFYLVGHATEALREIQGQGDADRWKGLFGVAYRFLPNLEDVNFINATTSGRPVAWDALGMGAVAMLCWSALFIWGAALLFSRREL